MQYATGLGHTHLAQHVVRIHMRGALLVRVLMTQMQLHRNIAAYGKLKLARHTVDLHVVGRRRDIVVVIHVVVQTDLANANA